MKQHNFSMGLRRASRSISDEEIKFIYQEIKKINADPSVFSIDKLAVLKLHIVK